MAERGMVTGRSPARTAAYTHSGRATRYTTTLPMPLDPPTPLLKPALRSALLCTQLHRCTRVPAATQLMLACGTVVLLTPDPEV